MWDILAFISGRVLLVIGTGLSIALILFGLIRREGDLRDSYTTELLKNAIEKNCVLIIQAPGEALSVTPVPEKCDLNENQNQRLQTIVRQFVAAANWGLGKPFVYTKLESGVRKATRFNSEAFVYKDPFTSPPSEVYQTPIWSSSEISSRQGWRVVGRELSLFLKRDASLDESEIVWSGAPVESNTLGPPNLVARRFHLVTPDGSGMRISIGASADIKENGSTCRIEFLGRSVRPGMESQDYRSGDYFVWQGHPFAVYEVNGDESQSALIITKRINGELSRINLLGAATNNLIGARWRGDIPYLDGALDHQTIDDVTLTIDPDLQSGAFFMLRQMLDKINGAYGIGRSRLGSVAILDERNGAIRALAGYPSYDTEGTETRRILLEDDFLPRNPSFDPHMAGSTVKVMTVALGYLLFNQAQADLLPTSSDVKAVQQAFQDAYGVALNAPLRGDEAQVTPEAIERFNKVGGTDRVLAECVQVLERVFNVTAYVEPRDEREEIISQNLQHFFKSKQLQNYFPYRSHWPIKDTRDMATLRRHALGEQDALFTTLRLAAILAIAGSGHVLNPYLVETIKSTGGQVERGGAGAVRQIDLPWNGLAQRVANMRGGMIPQLKKVLVKGGTGFLFVEDRNNKAGRKIYLAEDDAATIYNEGQRADIDYGKTGTANYGKKDERFQDSLFVYHHGNYLVAVWLEQSDKGKNLGEDEKFWLRHPAHILTYRLIQLIEALETQNTVRRQR